MSTIKSKLENVGDLGEVAQHSRKRQNKLFFAAKPKLLTVNGILESLRSFAQITGLKSQDRKVKHLQKLLVAAVDEEPRYIIRFMQVFFFVRDILSDEPHFCKWLMREL